MVNFKDIMKNKNYRRAETITDNVSYNCSEKGIYTPSKMTADSIIGNNYDAKNGDIFVNASEGDYRIKAEAKKTLGMRDVLDETFDMSDIGISDDSLINISAAEFALVFPADNAGIADTETLLKWEKSPFADEYIYEIASDSSFENIIDCGTTPYNVVKVSGLQEKSEYFWRVTAVNKSKQIGGEYRCNSIFRFTTSGELLFENIVYDKVMGEISFDVSNTKKQQDMFTVIIAAKSDSGELLALRTSGKTVAAEDKKTMFIGTYFDGIDMNSAKIEFYIWNSMNGMMNLIDKKVF